MALEQTNNAEQDEALYGTEQSEGEANAEQDEALYGTEQNEGEANTEQNEGEANVEQDEGDANAEQDEVLYGTEQNEGEANTEQNEGEANVEQNGNSNNTEHNKQDSKKYYDYNTSHRSFNQFAYSFGNFDKQDPLNKAYSLISKGNDIKTIRGFVIIDRIINNTNQRKKLLYWATILISIYLIVICYIVTHNMTVIDLWFLDPFMLYISDQVMMVLLGTTTANIIGLGYIVLKGTFYFDDIGAFAKRELLEDDPKEGN